MSVLNAIYKQVGVDSEIYSDSDTDGRSVWGFFNGLYKILVLIFAVKLLEIVK